MNSLKVRNASHLFLTAVAAITLHAGCGDSVTEAVDEVVQCRSLPGDRTARKVDGWKYCAIRDAAVQIEVGDKGLTIPQFVKHLRQFPGENLKDEIDDFEEVVEYVILEMEVRGEFERVAGQTGTSEPVSFIKPQVEESVVES